MQIILMNDKYMIRLINFIELNIVDNETDALLLENNFIKL